MRAGKDDSKEVDEEVGEFDVDEDVEQVEELVGGELDHGELDDQEDAELEDVEGDRFLAGSEGRS